MKTNASIRTMLAAITAFMLSVGAGSSNVQRTALTAHDLFLDRIVPSLEIAVSAPHIEKLRTNSRRDVPAKVRVNGGPEFPAQIHLKGHGSFKPINEKPGFTLKFQADSPLSLRKIHLNNSVDDPTYALERLGSEVFQTAGMPVQRVGHARVTLNGRILGLYVLKEGITPQFLLEHFGDASGDLFEGELDGESPLRRAAADPDLNARWDKLSALLDIDQFLAFLALEVLLCHWDGYALAGNNVRIYRGSDEKFHFLPSGMDQVFAHAKYPVFGQMTGALGRAVMETPKGRAAFHSKIAKLAPVLFAAHLPERINSVSVQLERHLSGSRRREAREASEELAAAISERESYIRRTLHTSASAGEIK